MESLGVHTSLFLDQHLSCTLLKADTLCVLGSRQIRSLTGNGSLMFENLSLKELNSIIMYVDTYFGCVSKFFNKEFILCRICTYGELMKKKCNILIVCIVTVFITVRFEQLDIHTIRCD